MSIPARISIVTLGVADLGRSIAFYEALGWDRVSSSVEGEIAVTTRSPGRPGCDASAVVGATAVRRP